MVMCKNPEITTRAKFRFHGVENSVLGLLSGAVERSTRRPLSTVNIGQNTCLEAVLFLP